jgi:hypothetical protein
MEKAPYQSRTGIRTWWLNTAGAERLDTLTAASSQPEANPSTAKVTFDLSRLSKENRVRFREATGRMVVAARLQVSYNLNLYALTWGTLQGAYG